MSPTRRFCLNWLTRAGWSLDAEWPSGRVSISNGAGKIFRAADLLTAYHALRYNGRNTIRKILKKADPETKRKILEMCKSNGVRV